MLDNYLTILCVNLLIWLQMISIFHLHLYHYWVTIHVQLIKITYPNCIHGLCAVYMALSGIQILTADHRVLNRLIPNWNWIYVIIRPQQISILLWINRLLYYIIAWKKGDHFVIHLVFRDGSIKSDKWLIPLDVFSNSSI